MSVHDQKKLTKEQEKLFDDEDFLYIFLYLADHEVTIDQLCKFTKVSHLKVAHILNKLMDAGIVTKFDSIGDRNVQFSTYSVTSNNIDMSPMAEKNKVGTTHLITKKLQTDLTEVLQRQDVTDIIPKISHSNFKLSKESYEKIMNKLNEVFELAKELENQDKNSGSYAIPAILFVSLYSRKFVESSLINSQLLGE